MNRRKKHPVAVAALFSALSLSLGGCSLMNTLPGTPEERIAEYKATLAEAENIVNEMASVIPEDARVLDDTEAFDMDLECGKNSYWLSVSRRIYFPSSFEHDTVTIPLRQHYESKADWIVLEDDVQDFSAQRDDSTYKAQAQWQGNSFLIDVTTHCVSLTAEERREILNEDDDEEGSNPEDIFPPYEEVHQQSLDYMDTFVAMVPQGTIIMDDGGPEVTGQAEVDNSFWKGTRVLTLQKDADPTEIMESIINKIDTDPAWDTWQASWYGEGKHGIDVSEIKDNNYYWVIFETTDKPNQLSMTLQSEYYYMDDETLHSEWARYACLADPVKAQKDGYTCDPSK